MSRGQPIERRTGEAKVVSDSGQLRRWAVNVERQNPGTTVTITPIEERPGMVLVTRLGPPRLVYPATEENRGLTAHTGAAALEFARQHEAAQRAADRKEQAVASETAPD